MIKTIPATLNDGNRLESRSNKGLPYLLCGTETTDMPKRPLHVMAVCLFLMADITWKSPPAAGEPQPPASSFHCSRVKRILHAVLSSLQLALHASLLCIKIAFSLSKFPGELFLDFQVMYEMAALKSNGIVMHKCVVPVGVRIMTAGAEMWQRLSNNNRCIRCMTAASRVCAVAGWCRDSRLSVPPLDEALLELEDNRPKTHTHGQMTMRAGSLRWLAHLKLPAKRHTRYGRNACRSDVIESGPIGIKSKDCNFTPWSSIRK